MDFLNRIKGFLGFSSGVNSQKAYEDRTPPTNSVRDVIVREDPPELQPDEFSRFGFNVFSSPLEMHRYFEHQMNEMMKSFGMIGDHDSFFGNSLFGGNGEPFFDDNTFNNDNTMKFPRIEEFEKAPGSLREQYLKPGYEQASPNAQIKTDKDLDGKFDVGDLETVLRGTPSQVQPRTFTFGQSMSTKTVRNPDGSVETHRTVRDQQGNEETTVTHRQGDKEYSITTRTDKDGHQEIIENLVNIDENDKSSFLKGTGPYGRLSDDPENLPAHWFPFDKFFK